MTAHDSEDLLCGYCGYNLRGMAAGACPECGIRFDPAILSDVLMPWERRREIGRFRAYWQTVREVSFHPSRAAARIAYPVSLKSAKSFRRVTSVIVVVSLSVLAWQVAAIYAPSFSNPSYQPPISALHDWASLILHSWSAAAIAAATVAAVTLTADVPTAFFGGRLPEPRRRRAGTLGMYSSATLAWFLPLTLAWAAVLSWADSQYGVVVFLNDILLDRAWLVMGVMTTWWLIVAAVLLRLTTRCSVARCVAMILVTMVAGPLLLVVLNAAFLAAVNFAALLWISAR